MLEVKKKHTFVIENKNDFDELISKLDTPEERFCELEIISNESLKTKKQGEQRLRKKT